MPTGASHLLKIGFNAGNAERAKFGKLRGFCVFRNVQGPDGRNPVDYDLMTALIAANVRREPDAAAAWRAEMKRIGIACGESNPVTREAVERAIAEQMKGQLSAADNILPRRIEFIILSAAVRDDRGEWTFPGTYNERFEAYKVGGCKGLYCHGDGDTASRWQPDGTRKTIPCNPVGKAGIEDAKLFCPHSTPTKRVNAKGEERIGCDCLPVGRLSLMLCTRDDRGKLVPLSRVADARFEVETRSERGQERFASALRQAAERLDGNIGGVSGTIWFAIQGMLAPAHAGGQLTTAQQLGITLNEFDIQAREAAFRSERLLEAAAVKSMLALPGPVAGAAVEPADDEQPDDGVIDVEHTTVSEATPVPAAPADPDAPDDETGAVDSPDESAPLTVATASDDEVFAALDSLAVTLVQEEHMPFADVCGRHFAFEYRDGTFRPESAGWFMEQKGKDASKHGMRMKRMREVAERFERANDPRFVLRRLAVAGGAR